MQMAVTDKLFLVPAAKCACRHLLGAIKFDFAHVCIMNLPADGVGLKRVKVV